MSEVLKKIQSQNEYLCWKTTKNSDKDWSACSIHRLRALYLKAQVLSCLTCLLNRLDFPSVSSMLCQICYQKHIKINKVTGKQLRYCFWSVSVQILIKMQSNFSWALSEQEKNRKKIIFSWDGKTLMCTWYIMCTTFQSYPYEGYDVMLFHIQIKFYLYIANHNQSYLKLLLWPAQKKPGQWKPIYVPYCI